MTTGRPREKKLIVHATLYYYGLTPSQGEESFRVRPARIKHNNHHQVEKYAFAQHPTEHGQKEVMHDDSHCLACFLNSNKCRRQLTQYCSVTNTITSYLATGLVYPSQKEDESQHESNDKIDVDKVLLRM